MANKVSKQAIEKFKTIEGHAMKLGLAIMCNKVSAEKYLESNSILLTTRAAVYLMQKETGLSDKEFWEKGNPTPIRKSKY